MTKEPALTDTLSKTQRKKDALALRDLGAALTSFKSGDLDRLHLDSSLRQAIDEYQKLPNAYGARKRQMQFIGKIMRDCNSDEIRENILLLGSLHQKKQQPLSVIDELVEKITNEGDLAIDELVASQKNLERHKLRQLKKKITSMDPDKQNSAKNKLKTYLISVVEAN